MYKSRNIDFGIFDVVSLLEDSRKPPEEVLLLKYGLNKYMKLTGDNGEFNFTPDMANAYIKTFNTRKIDVVWDYDHASLKGGKAPAAGWSKQLIKTDKGLVVKTEWTDEARSHLEKGEYRYFSPVLKFVDNWLHSIALTNQPSLDDISALVADSFLNNQTNNKQKGKSMEELLKMLGLESFSASSGEDQEKEITKKVKEYMDTQKGVDEFLKLHSVDSLDALTVKMQGLIPAEEKQKLEEEIKKRDAETAVALAVDQGKITEAKRPWAIGVATKDLEAFNALMKGAPKVVPDNKNTEQKTNTPNDALALSAEDKKIWGNMGFSEEEMKEMIKEKKGDN